MPHIRQIPDQNPLDKGVVHSLVYALLCPGYYHISYSKKKKDSNKCSQLLEYKYFSKNN